MNLRSLMTELKEIKESILKSNNTYVCHREENGTFVITFDDHEKFRLPIIDFRPYQREAQIKLFIEKFKRLFLVRPRRAGKEVESWNFLLQGAIEDPGLYLMIYPTNVRARMVLWDGAMILEDGSSLKFLDMIPERLIMGKPNKSNMTITLINGSIIQVLGSDIDPEKLRGINVRGAVFSEYAYSDPRVLMILMPIFRQNKGWFIIQTTFNGFNHAYRYMQDVKNNPAFYCRVDSAETLVDDNGQRYITEDMIDEDRKSGMPEHLIQQEYYNVVLVNNDRYYFSNEIKHLDENNKIISGLFLPNTPAYVFMDIGVNDSTFLVIAQFDRNGNPVIIGDHENNNKPFEYYVEWAKKFCWSHGIIVNCFYGPHDGVKRDYNLKTTVDFGRDAGVQVLITAKPLKKIHAIQQMRKMCYRAKFNKENTSRLIDCLSNYEKQFDEKLNVYKNDPIHNWASHGVDGFQTMTLAIDAQMINEKTYEIIYNPMN